MTVVAAASRWKTYRQRQKAGRIVVECEVDEAKLVAILTKARKLTPLQADDRVEVDRAWQEWVDEIFED